MIAGHWSKIEVTKY